MTAFAVGLLVLLASAQPFEVHDAMHCAREWEQGGGRERKRGKSYSETQLATASLIVRVRVTKKDRAIGDYQLGSTLREEQLGKSIPDLKL